MTIAFSSSGLKGFGRKSYAPNFIASTADSTVAYPVITITIVSGVSLLILFKTSIPLIPGIFKSRITISKSPSAIILRL